VLQNVGDDCQLNVVLPKLEELNFTHFSGDGPAVQRMITAATKLKSFDSFKLHCADHLTFASNELSEIRLHQAEFLSSLTIWAPRLRYLNLQASNPSRITIQDTHAMLETHPLPKGFTPTPIQVFTLNATCLRSQLSFQLQEYLTGHQRVKCAHTFESDEDEDDIDCGECEFFNVETEEFVESAIAHKENGEEIPSDVLAAFDNTPDFVKAFVQDAPLEMWQTIETGDDGAIVPAVHIMNQSEKTMREFVVGPETRDFGR